MARRQNQGNELKVTIVGGPRTPLSDLYHVLLRWPWWAAVVTIAVMFLFLNAVFGLVFLWVGGIQNMAPHSFIEAFFFSVHTMGTIGYGSMFPVSRAANVVVVVESVVGLLLTAVSTGLVFAKFSQARGRIVFTRQVVLTPMDGVPSLMLRLGNERTNRIIEAQVRVVMFRTQHTREGKTFYRMYDVPLVRDPSQALSRSWTILHTIDAKSPLQGLTPKAMKELEVELVVSVFGLDDTTLQPVHASRRYTDDDILWGARHVDILHEANGEMTLDLRDFHRTEPSAPQPDFPYPLDAQAPTRDSERISSATDQA